MFEFGFGLGVSVVDRSRGRDEAEVDDRIGGWNIIIERGNNQTKRFNSRLNRGEETVKTVDNERPEESLLSPTDPVSIGQRQIGGGSVGLNAGDGRPDQGGRQDGDNRRGHESR